MQERTKGCPVYSLDTCNDDDDFAEPVRIRVGEIQCVEHERDRAGVVYEGGNKVNKLKLLRKKCVIDICESAYIVGVRTSSKKRRRDVKVGSSFVGGTRLDVTCKKKLALRKKLSSTGAKCEEKKKKVRTYNRYIQKKFSPSIFSEVIENLSKPQIKWIKDTGFGDLLNFKMQCYPHNLGYNVVEIFDASTCSLVFKGRTIKITEGLVQSTLGFPLGGKCVQFSESEEPYSVWGKQFPGRASSLISPLMVRHVMSENTEADAIFKWNFLMLMYNFFIESNQNAFLLRDVLRFSGNIDECGEYNWCSLMLDKLKTTQTYWAESPKRNFTGALPLLIYVYVDQVRTEQNKDVVRTEPAYVAWTDALLRERQKYETKYKCFGIGKIESGAENVEDEETDMMNDADLANIVNGLSLHDCINSEDNDANTQINNGNMCNANEVLLGDNCEKVDDVLPGTNIVRGEGGNDKGIELELGQDMELDEGDRQVKKTQELIDEEIDQIFDEDSYVEQFERNVIELKEGYRRCVTDYVTVLALFPRNAKVEELKEEYAIFFKVFEELSPVSKKLAVCNAIENAAKYSAIENEEDLPSFSLGLSQNISRNLGFEFGTVAQSYIESRFGTKMSEDEYRAGENEGDYVNDAGDMRENNDNDDGVKIRPRREMRATHVQKSPYISRVVDIRRRKISIVERQVWYWLFQNRRNKKETLFECGDLMCTRGHFQSMQEKKLVNATVIDTWSHLLNENEIMRADSSPLRLFLTTETTYGPMEMLVNDNDVDAKIKRYALFDDNMDVVLKMVNDLHNKRYEGMEFDMFVFPVYYSGHFYIICYNVKKPSWEIIDNMVLTVPFEEKYGSLPARMHDCFCHWLSAFDMPKEREIKNLKPNVLKKNWQTVDNFIDCGIFVMRHMATYMGNAYRWNSGLPAESVTQRALLDKLRIIYCYMMLTWRGNKKRNSVIQAIANQAKR